jgi:hypothetical protein
MAGPDEVASELSDKDRVIAVARQSINAAASRACGTRKLK